MSIQSFRRGPIANVRCCAESLCPKGLWQARVVGHGTDGIGEYPNHSFCHTVRRRVERDRGVQLDAVALADVAHLSHR